MPHVFLSYHGPDRAHVERVRDFLRSSGFDTFFDQASLSPGEPWPRELERALESAESVALFIGRQMGGWQKREMWFALDRQKETEDAGGRFAVVPVLLPGANLQRSFLFQNTWIDLRSQADERVALEKLVQGLRGSGAGRQTAASGICPYRGLHA